MANDSTKKELQGLSITWQFAVFFVLLLLIFSRRPQDVYYANFYAEDGKRWFAQAYNVSWLASLRIPDASYLQVLPRLAAGLALCVPLRLAPLLMNCIGAAIQALPVLALLSHRCFDWGSLKVRVGLSLIYIALPNAPEVHVNITNAQWHLALLESLLAFGSPSKRWASKILDVLIFLVGAFSGPFCIVLMPALLFFWWQKREGWSLVLALCLAIGVFFQCHTILSGDNYAAPYEAGMPVQPARIEASRIPLGATPSLLIKIVGGDIVLNSMIGYCNVAELPLFVATIGLLLGAVIFAYGLRYGPLCLRLFALQTLILTAAAMISPVIFVDGADRWTALTMTGGMRYYFFPSLAFLWASVYCFTCAPWKGIRVTGCVVLFIALGGIVRQWEYPPLPYARFDASVDRFNHARRGDRVTIPIAPEPWTMTLVKH